MNGPLHSGTLTSVMHIGINGRTDVDGIANSDFVMMIRHNQNAGDVVKLTGR